jgi:hypothetical protein
MKILPRKQNLPSRQHHKPSLILIPEPNILLILLGLDFLCHFLILRLFFDLLINKKHLLKSHHIDIKSLCRQCLMSLQFLQPIIS